MRLAGNIALIGDKVNGYRILVGNPEEKMPGKTK
jgi:hypothetical protein